MVKYRPWRRQSQPKVKIDTKKRVTPMKTRKTRRDAMESITSSDAGTLVPEGEGFGYPPKCFTDPNYPYISDDEEEKEQKEECPHDENDRGAAAEDSNSAHRSMLREEALVPNKIKFEMGPYCPICTPTGYRCMCNDEGSDWNGTVVTYHPSSPGTNKPVMVPTLTRDSEDDVPDNSEDDTPGRICT